VSSPLSDALGASGPTRKTLQRNELLHYAAHGPGEVTTEQALRALILELARRWPEWLSAQGPISAEAEAAFEQRIYRDRRSPAQQNRETRFPETTGGSLELPERDTWADDPRTKSLSARIVELERGKVEEEE
jgi:hypothetical protein